MTYQHSLGVAMNRAWNWNRTRDFLGVLGIAFFSMLVFAGCGGKGATDPAQYYGNYHPTGWINIHGGPAVAGVAACTKCHEISIIRVGSGIPTCLTTGCHHQSNPGFSDPTIHGVRAKMAANAVTGGSLVSCQICHASDFSGGASANACSTCHSVSAPHPPKPWRNSGGSVFTHTTVDPSNATVCAQCHYPGSPNNPAGHPATPAPAGTQPGCYNATLCHGAAGTAPHPVPFLKGQTDSSLNGHLTVTATAFAADCAACHAYSGVSPASSAPLCNVCHKLADPTASGANAGTCLSCHSGAAGLANGPGGSGFPSLTGAHPKHMALATQLTCDSCHAGSGAGTTAHYTNANARTGVPTGPATVSMDAIYAAQTGGNPTFTGSSLTCSNVSCHGGQATPGWVNGTINSSTQCTMCHKAAASAGTITQYNDAFGRHSEGTHDATVSGNGIACTTCHNMANGSPGALAHFKYLNTHAVDGTSTGIPADQLPSGTIAFDPAFLTGAGTYAVTGTGTAQGNGGCALTCHTPTKTHIHNGAPLDTWLSTGAPHPVPFLGGQSTTQGNGHLNATPVTFASDCSTCHVYSGTSPTPGAPSCATCHTVADPTSAATGTGTCLSCHAGPSGIPAGPTGTAFPNIAGSHAKHMGLLTALSCDSCHAGSGTGTAAHYANANARVTPPAGPASVNIDATFNAQSGGVAGQGSAGFNPSSLSCNTVSCHGGQATPNWQTGTITSTSQCSLCHAINSGASSSQYNDALGRHSYGTHSNASALDCTLCHDMTSANTNAGAVRHFAELNTPAVSSTNKLPSGTIKFKLTNATYPITGAATYTISATTPEGDGGCALSCHNQVHNAVDNHWAAPKGSGVAHPIPFLATDVSAAGNHHQTVTAAQFTGECATCHDATGTTTTKTGPICTVCHTLGSPVAAGLTAGTCLSCHTGANFTTNGPTGSAWPNLTGAHPKHLSLLTFTRTTPALPASLTASTYPDCEACHVGSVPGDATNTHYSNANMRVTPHAAPASVAIDPTFNAQASVAGISASASAFTCSNISCHGGQTTPGWQTGTNPVNTTTYCIACHVAGSAQYNAPTGRHTSSEHRQTCDYCHSMTVALPGAQNHFKYLDTTTVSGVSGTPADQYPSDTILFGSVPTGAKTYTVTGTGNAQGKGGCALSCHGQTHTTTGNHWN
jgi:predicted CxxxxCH...CXXCH cytochrome family protein